MNIIDIGFRLTRDGLNRLLLDSLSLEIPYFLADVLKKMVRPRRGLPQSVVVRSCSPSLHDRIHVLQELVVFDLVRRHLRRIVLRQTVVDLVATKGREREGRGKMKDELPRGRD